MKRNQETLEALGQMTGWQQTVFAAALTERMFPNYRLFADVTNTEGAAQFRSILNLVWEHLSAQNNAIDFDKQLDKLEKITPDPNAFDLYGVWPALDATVSLSSVLSVCLRWEPQEILAIERLSRSTIDGYQQAIDDPEQGDESELEQLEMRYKEELIQLLADSSEQGKANLVRQVKGFVKEWGVSNIGLEML